MPIQAIGALTPANAPQPPQQVQKPDVAGILAFGAVAVPEGSRDLAIG